MDSQLKPERLITNHTVSPKPKEVLIIFTTGRLLPRRSLCYPSTLNPKPRVSNISFVALVESAGSQASFGALRLGQEFGSLGSGIKGFSFPKPYLQIQETGLYTVIQGS